MTHEHRRVALKIVIACEISLNPTRCRDGILGVKITRVRGNFSFIKLKLVKFNELFTRRSGGAISVIEGDCETLAAGRIPKRFSMAVVFGIYWLGRAAWKLESLKCIFYASLCTPRAFVARSCSFSPNWNHK